MKRLILSFAAVMVVISISADDYTTVIKLNDGTVYAIYNKKVNSISFTNIDLNEKYYKLSPDTIILHDSIYLDKIITKYETVYVHDTIYIQDQPQKSTYYINNQEYQIPEAVDLGLPSGTLWSNMDLGSNSYKKVGELFAFGETSPKNEYTWENYQHAGYIDENQMNMYIQPHITTLLGKGEFRCNISSTKLDAANVCIGGDWALPTIEQMLELQKYCSWEKINIEGIDYFKISGNGNYIYLVKTKDTWQDCSYMSGDIVYATKYGWTTGHTLASEHYALSFFTDRQYVEEWAPIKLYPLTPYYGNRIRPVNNKNLNIDNLTHDYRIIEKCLTKKDRIGGYKKYEVKGKKYDHWSMINSTYSGKVGLSFWIQFENKNGDILQKSEFFQVGTTFAILSEQDYDVIRINWAHDPNSPETGTIISYTLDKILVPRN